MCLYVERIEKKKKNETPTGSVPAERPDRACVVVPICGRSRNIISGPAARRRGRHDSRTNTRVVCTPPPRDSLATSARTRPVVRYSASCDFFFSTLPTPSRLVPSRRSHVGRPPARSPHTLPTHLRRFFAGIVVPAPDWRPVFSSTTHVRRSGVR